MIIFLTITTVVGWAGILVLWLIYQNYVKGLKSDIGTLSDVNEKLNESIDQKADSISQLFEMIESISHEKVMYRKRVIELEDAIEKSYGVTIRKEVTKIIVDFNKLEMVVLLTGVYKLLKTSKTVEDGEFYINLTKKLQQAIDKMPDDEEEEKKQ